MTLCDTHVHSKYSFDADDSVDDICKAAVSKGLASIVITDHCDLDCELAGLYPKLDCEGVRRDVFEAKEKYKGILEVGYGIELGQPYNVPEEAERMKKKYNYDLILCSVHNLKDVPDFSFLDFRNMPSGLVESLIDRYFTDLLKSAEYPGVDIITHTSYPARYLHKCGIAIDLMKYSDRYTELFRKMIESGKALEYNVSGLRRGTLPSPTNEIMKLYRSVGGELVSCGSDAHLAPDTGCDIKAGYDFLSSVGFDYVTVYLGGKKTQLKIK